MRLLAVIVVWAFFLAGCSPSPVYRSGASRPATKTKSSLKSTKTDSKKKKEKFTGLDKVQYGVASYYGKDFHGRLTANGEIFDMFGISAAHKDLPLGTVIRVTNLDNKKELVCRINDRGPYVEGRILDLSFGAAQKLGFVGNGTANIKLRVLQLGDGEYKKQGEKK